MSPKSKAEAKHSDEFADFQSPTEASLDKLVDALDRAYHRPWLMMWRSFLHGFMAAIGAVLGTIFIGIVSVYLFQVLGGPSILKPYVEKLQDSTTKAVQNKLNPENTPTPTPTASVSPYYNY